MKMEKKHWIIIGIVVTIILIWYFFFKNKKAESSYQTRKKSKCEVCYDNFSRGLKGCASSAGVVQQPGVVNFSSTCFDKYTKELLECTKQYSGPSIISGPVSTK